MENGSHIEADWVSWLTQQFPTRWFEPSSTLSPQEQMHLLESRFDRFEKTVHHRYRTKRAFKGSHVIVGGTSGKGSCATFIAQGLVPHVSRVGLFLSPHVNTVRERFSIIDREAGLIYPEFDELSAIASDIAAQNPEASLFEALFLIAGQYFSKQACTYVVWEVGCGGRLDAVNALPHKEVSVVTNVQLDHTEWLGSTRAAIAHEKAPIFTNSQACLYGEADPNLIPIFEKYRQLGDSRAIPCDECLFACNDSGQVVAQLQNGSKTLPYWGLGSRKNLSLAHAVIQHFGFGTDGFVKAVSVPILKGRLELVSRNPHVLFDIAHNPHKLTDTLDVCQKWNHERKRCVLAFSELKDGFEMLRLASKTFHEIWVCSFKANQGRSSVPKSQLLSWVDELSSNAPVLVCDSVDQAMALAQSGLGTQDLLVVTGSTFLYREAISKCLVKE